MYVDKVRAVYAGIVVEGGLVEGAADRKRAAIEGVGVDHGGGDIVVTE